MSFAVSTRGAGPVSFADALFQGLAPDGGLYLPRVEPRLEGPPAGPDAPFAETAAATARAFLAGAVEPWVVDRVVADALDFPAPLVPVEDGVWVLELFHGPTLAFKDVGARFLARAMSALDEEDGSHTVLVATSGDTGGAVADAFHGLLRHRVVALFPRGGISERQRRQMTTLGGNVRAVAVEGTFDDCQRMAKEAFADPELRRACGLTSANSINLGRLLPQAFYYVHAAVQAGWDGPAPTWVVPAGNLGNLCAGVLAVRAGVPGASFVAALNRNRTFLDYLESGRYAPRASLATPSSAMDVGAPSNLERLRALHDGDAGALGRVVRAVSVDDHATLHAMAAAREEWNGMLLDPHTGVARAAWEALGRPRPAILLATAHPAKFPEAVREATGRTPSVPARLARRLEADEVQVEVAPELEALRPLLLDTAQ
jgi:threonine synthase